jgi:hypothetical protein
MFRRSGDHAGGHFKLLAQFPVGMVSLFILVPINRTHNLDRAVGQLGSRWKALVLPGDENSEDMSATAPRSDEYIRHYVAIFTGGVRNYVRHSQD